MKCAAALALLVLSAPAAAIWPFGPSDADECIQEYAVEAAERRLVGAAVSACRRAFDDAVNPVHRKAALCLAKRIPDMKSAAAFGFAREKCDADAGVTECRWPQVADSTTNRCKPV
mgnify:CR=1 FL=1